MNGVTAAEAAQRGRVWWKRHGWGAGAVRELFRETGTYFLR
ncbi:hypothetical protein [Ruminococcus sp.]|nr:hypothetical protein [Ruminococcus sp.]MEE0143100.1 hypothetical protein [Ruminococcus sp.]